MGTGADPRTRLLTLREASELLHGVFGRRFSVRLLRRLISGGALRAVRDLHGRHRVTRCDLCATFLDRLFGDWHPLEPPTDLQPRQPGDRLHTIDTLRAMLHELLGRAPSRTQLEGWMASGELPTEVDAHGRVLFHNCDACRLWIQTQESPHPRSNV